MRIGRRGFELQSITFVTTPDKNATRSFNEWLKENTELVVVGADYSTISLKAADGRETPCGIIFVVYESEERKDD